MLYTNLSTTENLQAIYIFIYITYKEQKKTSEIQDILYYSFLFSLQAIYFPSTTKNYHHLNKKIVFLGYCPKDSVVVFLFA
jgi:hypothetical protein